MIGERIESILGVFGDAVFARCNKGNLYSTSLAGIPTPALEPEMQGDPAKWIIRRKLSAALIRPEELKWSRQDEWAEGDLTDASLRADTRSRYGW